MTLRKAIKGAKFQAWQSVEIRQPKREDLYIGLHWRVSAVSATTTASATASALESGLVI